MKRAMIVQKTTTGKMLTMQEILNPVDERPAVNGRVNTSSSSHGTSSVLGMEKQGLNSMDEPVVVAESVGSSPSSIEPSFQGVKKKAFNRPFRALSENYRKTRGPGKCRMKPYTVQKMRL